MLVVGLGNPGTKYSLTKHNFGFWILDKIVEASSLKWKSGYGDYLYVKNNDIIFAKPTSFMNHSGIAVKDLCKHYNQTDLIIVYDDIDLPFGKIKYKSNGSNGGHKGIESIIYHLHTDQFNRLRLGIATDTNMRPSEEYVLSPFSKNMNEEVKIIINNACDSIDYYLNHDLQSTMNNFN